MDFTLNTYHKLLNSLLSRGFSFYSVADFFELSKEIKENESRRLVMLRHDVDAKPANSLRFAKIQKEKGIVGTYYFRVVPESFDPKIISEIFSLGHEIGYHYETMDSCKGDVDKAYEQFCINLEQFRKLVPVRTIAMHGSPMSAFDNREIWKKYDYKKLGLIGEPYFDIDFNKVFYLTDTGRRWDGHRFNVRDKVLRENPVTNPDFLRYKFRTTNEIIKALNGGNFPDNAMFNFHPQRWTNELSSWLKEYIWQNVKNQGKWLMIRLRYN